MEYHLKYVESRKDLEGRRAEKKLFPSEKKTLGNTMGLPSTIKNTRFQVFLPKEEAVANAGEVTWGVL